MTEYFLQIRLQSPLTSAAGEGRVGVVDRDIAFDDLGLPILPGRRLKGLWREAYRDVADAWTLCGESPIPVDCIFGKSGQKSGKGDACLYVANAELQEASSLREWLKYLQYDKKLHSDDVVEHFATVRAQTAINRRTGTALENTLRLTRTLKAGFKFQARVRFCEPPDNALLNALSLGAAALQHMGTARTRGLGKVSCRLHACDENGQYRDLTKQVLSSDALPSITKTDLAQPVQSSKGQTTAAPTSNRATPTHLLRYRLKLIAPAVIPAADGDPNTVMTRRDVPGSHVWGAAAWHYLSQSNHAPEDDAFRRVFLDGSLRFLTAYPEGDDPEGFDEHPQRLIPIPHSIRKFKENEELVDFVERPSEKEPAKRLEHRYARIGQGSLETQAVKTELNYHHARAKDRSKGRPLGPEVPDGGAFFTYEAIQSGQSFQGAVLGSKDDLKNLQTWLQRGQIRIGRSRSAQYGEAKFAWLDDEPKELSGLVEWDGFVEQQPPDVTSPDKCLTITTLSPLLAANDYGHPEARFPKGELVEALGVELKLSRSYTRTEVIGGYNAHLRLPRQQWPAISPGSVFVFNTEKSLDQERLLQLEHSGLGLRKGEGYGRIAVNRQGSLGLWEETQLDDPNKQNRPDAPDSERPQSVQDLLYGVVRSRCLDEMQQRAMTVAERAQNIPSNALLGRLRLFLQQDAPVESLNNLRKPAEEGLTNCRVNTDILGLSRRTTLYDLFKKAWTEPESLTRELIESHVEELVEDRDTRQTLIKKLVQNDSEEMCAVLLDHLLTALRRNART